MRELLNRETDSRRSAGIKHTVDEQVCSNSKRQLPFIVCRPRKTNFRFPYIYIHMKSIISEASPSLTLSSVSKKNLNCPAKLSINLHNG